MVSVIENLKEAIIGESTAKKKYELFAKKANEENYKEIAHLFEAIAQAESIHIKNHLTSLSKIIKSDININDIVKINEQNLINIVSDTRNNLIQAIAGETFEFKKMYKSYIKDAKKEGFFVAEYTFDLARKAEMIHSKLFIKYLKQLDKNQKFLPIDIYICKICGNVELEKPPKICPICNHNQKFFLNIKI